MPDRRKLRMPFSRVGERPASAGFAEYGRAMGWELGPNGWTGPLGRRLIRAYEEHGAGVVVVDAPAVMPTIIATRVDRPAALPLLRPTEDGWRLLTPDPDLVYLGGGLHVVRTNDPYFDRMYRIEAAFPWFAHLVLSANARDALLAAPAQDWVTAGTHVVSVGAPLDEPLAVMARASALCEVLESVPWEAYIDPDVPPGRVRVVAALEARQERLRQREDDLLTRVD